MAQQKPHLIKEYDHPGQKDADVAKVVKVLSTCLADTYLMLLKTQNFHWNIEGRNFYGLHKLSEEQYLDLQSAVDEVAERIRSLGYFAPGRVTDLREYSDLKESTNPPYSEEPLIRELIKDHDQIAKNLRNGIETCEDQGDIATADLLTGRLTFHEKAMWMLRAIITEK